MSEGLLPGGKKDKRLTWEETYRETAREKEDWSDLEATVADGIDPRESGDSEAAIIRPRS
jgi:hypothetical protein